MDKSHETIAAKHFPGVIIQINLSNQQVIYLAGDKTSTFFPTLAHQKNLSLQDFRAFILSNVKTDIEDKTNADIEKNRCWSYEYPIEHEKKIRWIRETSYFPENTNEPTLGLFLSDISAEKLRESELEQRLTDSIQTATSKNQYFATMSHEIRTPMNAVMGMAQILNKTSLDLEQRQYVNTILSSSDALVQIINDILDLSKLEASKVELVEEDVNLEDLCLDICHLLAGRAKEKDLHIFLSYQATDAKSVLVDKGRLRQILINLLGNAIKFTNSGHVELEVNSSFHENITLFHFSIKDTGIGIPETAKDNLFNAYTQVDKSISQDFGGTGLGLQISKRLVELMDGKIGVESTEKQGSEFWFSLPLEVLQESSKPPLSGKTCLLIANKHYPHSSLHNTLASMKLDVSTATCPAEIEHYIARGLEFDFILIDENQDRLDGLDSAQLVTKIPRLKNTPIILLTAPGNCNNSVSLRDAGIHVFVSKPISSSLLTKAFVTSQSIGDNATKAVYISHDSHSQMDETEQTIHTEGLALIADDITVNQVILNTMLKQIGLDTEIVDNGKEALEKVQSENFDIIFMDCRMPVMDGYEATKHIKSLPNGKSSIPIIALTAKASEQDKQTCFQAGMDDFLSKPYKESDLRTVVSKWLQTEVTPSINAQKTQTSQPENEILDHLQFNSIKDSLENEFANFTLDITDKFLSYQKNIIDALRIGDMASVAELGHSLKGIAATIGAKQIAEIADSVEQAGDNNQLENAIIALSKLDPAIAKTHSMIIINLNPDIDKSLFLN